MLRHAADQLQLQGIQAVFCLASAQAGRRHILMSPLAIPEIAPFLQRLEHFPVAPLAASIVEKQQTCTASTNPS